MQVIFSLKNRHPFYDDKDEQSFYIRDALDGILRIKNYGLIYDRDIVGKRYDCKGLEEYRVSCVYKIKEGMNFNKLAKLIETSIIFDEFDIFILYNNFDS